jgi:hypothetical protein
MSFAQTTINQPGTNTVSVAELNLSDGTAGQAIVTDGNGTISFASVGVSGIDSSADATAITIDSSENVGIGETSPTAGVKLHITNATQVNQYLESTGNATNSILQNGADGNSAYVFNRANLPLTFGTNNAERMRINAAGGLSISDDVENGLNLNRTTTTTGASYMKFTNGGGNYYLGADSSAGDRMAIGGLAYGFTMTAESGRPIVFATSNTARMTLDSSGNVGIGTTSPTLKLDLSSSTSFGLPGTSGTTPVGFARIGYTDRTWSGNEILMGIINASANNYAGYIQCKVPTDYSSTRPFLINPQGGNVGIGTDSPDRVLEVSHDLNSHTPALRLTGTSTSAYAAGLEWYTGYGPKQTTTMYSTASGSQGAEFWMEHRNQDSNTLKRVWHISNTARHTFHGQHNGDSTGHFLFTNSLYDATSTNCTLAVENGATFIQIMGWSTAGARIGTRTGGWNSNSGGDVYLTRNDAVSIKLASSGPQLGSGTAISSDERLKENITNISDGQLAKINALTPRNFTWKDPRKTGTHEGFIAQEVEAVIPEAVFEDNFAPDPDDDSRDFEGDIKLIRHEVINARLIKAVQELSAKLEAAEERITTLENA